MPIGTFSQSSRRLLFLPDIKFKYNRYLVVYSTINPENNNLLVNRPVLGNLNIDSLNAIGVNIEEINYLY